MTVIVRGFADGVKRFEESLIDPSPAELRESAHKHAILMFDSGLQMIEFEFPELPESDRFLRFGTDPSRMVDPIAVDL